MKKFKISACLLLTVLLFACNKYEDGSNFSLLTAKNRMVGDWNLKSYKVNGVDQISSMPEIIISFDKKGIMKISQTQFGSTINETGKWEFFDKKKSVIITNETANSIDTLEIKQLKNKKLSFVQVTNSANIEMNLEIK